MSDQHAMENLTEAQENFSREYRKQTSYAFVFIYNFLYDNKSPLPDIFTILHSELCHLSEFDVVVAICTPPRSYRASSFIARSPIYHI